MPIFIKFDGVDGDVGAGGATGGVWRTTNFLTTDRSAAGPGGGPTVKVFSGSDGGGLLPANVVPLSRISLVSGVGGVDGRDPMPTRKAAELFRAARSAPGGKLYIATDAGVWRNSGRVREAANKLSCSNNLKQLGIGVHNYPAVEILVCDAGGANAQVYRLRNVSISRSQDSNAAAQRSRVTSLTVTFDGQIT